MLVCLLLLLLFSCPTEYFSQEWKPHVFVLFSDRLCFIDESQDSSLWKTAEDAVSVTGDDESQVSERVCRMERVLLVSRTLSLSQEDQMSGFGVRPEEMHVTEEWFHGKCDRTEAVKRLEEQKEKGNGVFLVRLGKRVDSVRVKRLQRLHNLHRRLFSLVPSPGKGLPL